MYYFSDHIIIVKKLQYLILWLLYLQYKMLYLQRRLHILAPFSFCNFSKVLRGGGRSGTWMRISLITALYK